MSMSSCRNHFDNVTGWMPIDRGLLGLLAGADQRDGTCPELRRIRARHDCQPSVKDCQLVTRTGTQDLGQVNMSPIRAADPTNAAALSR